ncbi:hypothetical protein D7030_04260 [Flavobacteriaceae bacterium AU392]|nr:hypothetical protein D1817_10735 [Flavobacteriaceae bacterium]RKM85891.1 hypothetical protein D7030_04260 [Flavobacteriaceae bacterium AU392]
MPKIFQSIRENSVKSGGLKKYLIYALGEIILVIIGILVALNINNLNEEHKEEKQQHAILASIKNELNTNLNLLQKAHKRRLLFYKGLDSITEHMTEDLKKVLLHNIPEDNNKLSGWTGLNPISLNGAMFETAKYSGILTNIDVELLQNLSYTYNKQQEINTIGNTFINRFFDMDTNKDINYDEYIGFMWRIREEFFGAQFLLMDDYKSSIELIENKIKITS